MRKNSVLLASCLLLSLAGCTLWPEKATKHWSNATGGESLERSFWNDVKDKHWADLDAHIAPNFVYVGNQGKVPRADALDYIHKFDLKDFSVSEVEVELNTQTLVVTYVLTLNGSHAGRPLTGNARRMMSVWQQQKAGWLLIAQSVIERP
jgi:hypothetical protein